METHVQTESAPARPQAAASPRFPVATPRVDIYENEQEILLLLDVPGVTAEDVHLEIDRSELTLWATTAADYAFGPVRWERSFLVPRGLDAEGVKAELRDGVLRVTLPKGEAARRRTVEVQGA